MKDTVILSDVHYLGFGKLLSELGGFLTSLRTGIAIISAPLIYYNFKKSLFKNRPNSNETIFKKRVSFQGIYNLHEKVEGIVNNYETKLSERDEIIQDLQLQLKLEKINQDKQI